MTDPAADGSALLDLALRAARGAGTELLSRYGRIEGLATKSSSTDPVSDADRAAEQLLVELIRRERPDDGLISEEGATRPSRSGITWVIDPLDGTVNYLYELGNFSVSIAAEDADGAIVGVVHDPASGRTFAAVRGAGAIGDGQRLQVNDPVPLERALLATGFAYTRDKRALQGELVARLLPPIRGCAALRIRGAGSVLRRERRGRCVLRGGHQPLGHRRRVAHRARGRRRRDDNADADRWPDRLSRRRSGATRRARSGAVLGPTTSQAGRRRSGGPGSPRRVRRDGVSAAWA